ncbi:EAL domain-containing protein [Lyngbya confervoides]|uniref:EAL domain-containing protein n=1 Tax=Lyngbya confervoides BDU141951 TaxID=1574623 RepID=A0ABD4T004_9CYAN|nr:EAL domain-containing protein [Lyngbya confervoides]MCM1981761.1 EAL domain-containing protein [Lyngbya confervoides BDU141951]
MNLSVFTQYYPPDFAATGQLMEELVTYLTQQQVQVQVFTGQPTYAFNASDAPTHEVRGGAKVQRTRVSKTRKFLGRTGSGLLYCLRSALHLLKQAHRGDLLLLTSEPPFLFVVGYVAHRLFRVPYVCLVYDLYPDAIVEFGIAQEKSLVVRFWNRVNRSVWERAESIIVLSETMKQRVVDKAPQVSRKISIIHNWSDPNWIKPIPKSENPFAAQHNLQNNFVVMYSGNMGRCHDMETIMDAAEALQQEAVQFVFIGAGPKRQDCIDRAEASGLKNCLFLPYQDKEVLPYSLTACDLTLVSVGAGMEGVVAPSKFYSALAAGRPIAAICESHSYLRQLIADANCGTAFQPGDSLGLVAFIRYLAKDSQRQATMGNMGSNYIKNRFTPDLIGQEYLQLVEQAVLKDSELRRGLVNREFQLLYQPLYSLRTGILSGLELLVYWQHPQKGLISPGEFLQFAENSGLIVEMGQAWLAEAFSHFRHFTENWQHPLLLKINLTAGQFFHPSLVPMLDQYMDRHNLTGQQICLDVAEEALMSDGAAATAILLQLQDRHIQVCLENFGQGATSVKFLNRFALNAVEIDRQVVNRLEFDPEADTLIESIILLAQGINLEVIAEGIETPKQLARLKALGAGYGKGFLFSKPRPYSEVLAQVLVESTPVPYVSEAKPKAQQNEDAPLILVIDDERGMRRLLRLAIAKEGYRMIEAETGAAGLELYRVHQPDLILLDGMMEDLDGFECCRRIRAEESAEAKVPILMITALDDAQSISSAYGCGATDYITKPVNWELLRQRLNRILPPQ